MVTGFVQRTATHVCSRVADLVYPVRHHFLKVRKQHRGLWPSYQAMLGLPDLGVPGNVIMTAEICEISGFVMMPSFVDAFVSACMVDLKRRWDTQMSWKRDSCDSRALDPSCGWKAF